MVEPEYAVECMNRINEIKKHKVVKSIQIKALRLVVFQPGYADHI